MCKHALTPYTEFRNADETERLTREEVGDAIDRKSH